MIYNLQKATFDLPPLAKLLTEIANHGVRLRGNGEIGGNALTSGNNVAIFLRTGEIIFNNLVGSGNR